MCKIVICFLLYFSHQILSLPKTFYLYCFSYNIFYQIPNYSKPASSKSGVASLNLRTRTVLRENQFEGFYTRRAKTSSHRAKKNNNNFENRLNKAPSNHSLTCVGRHDAALTNHKIAPNRPQQEKCLEGWDLDEIKGSGPRLCQEATGPRHERAWFH